MSEINSIANGSFVLGQTSATNFIAGPGISITQPSEGTVRIANDETVLLNNNYANETTQTFTISEPLSSFTRIRVAGLQYNSTLCEYEFPAPSGNENISILMQYYCPNGDSNPYQIRMGAYSTTNGLTYNAVSGKFLYYGNAGISAIGGNTTARPSIQKIWGINRIGGNE